MYFCECIDADNLPSTPAQETIKLATLDDVERIVQLQSNIAEFPTANESEKILKQALETNTGRTYYIEKDGAIIASASTSAENSLSAMVIGVCTHANYCRSGYKWLQIKKRSLYTDWKILLRRYSSFSKTNKDQLRIKLKF